MKTILHPLLALVVGAALLAFASCASAPKPRNYAINVEVDPALAGISLQVDFIGANPVSDLPKLESYSVTEYWKPGDPLRRDAAKITLSFGQGRPTKQSVDLNNPLWTRWLRTGAQHLVVLVDLPGVSADRMGNADPRRLILPLDANKWKKKGGPLDILIQESGARLLTPQKP